MIFPIFHQTLNAPAKLNLRLKIVGRRPDGYHLLSMWNVLTTLTDQMTIEIFDNNTSRVVVEVVGAPELSATTNIVEKAAYGWLHANEKKWLIRCRLVKSIPIGAGMGGGSSDAALMLSTLERVGGPSKSGELDRMALSLGADVPYFLKGGAAWVGGIGEQVHQFEVAGLDGHPCVIIMPKVSLSTKRMYDLVRDKFPTLPDFIAPIPDFPPPTFLEMQKLLENDFESIAASISPEIAEVLSALRSDRSLAAHMTGSGAALFALSQTAANNAEKNDTGDALLKQVRMVLHQSGLAESATTYLVRVITTL